MAGGITALDEAIREYLFFRGFVNTLKQFETERKEDRDKELNANKIVDYLLQCVERLDFTELRAFWTRLHDRFFCRLNHDCQQAAYKFETSLLRLYLIHATYQGKQEEVKNFFVEMSPALSSKKEWKDWFALPFTKNPEANPTFRIYFSREWYQTLNTSLRNFFSTIFTYLPKPSLLNFEQEQSRLQAVAAENHHLHNQLATTKNSLAAAEQQIQQLETKLAQKISQEASNLTVPVVKSKSKKIQKKKPADDTSVSIVPVTCDKGSSAGNDVHSVKESDTPAAFVDDFGEGVLTPYPIGPEGKSPFFPVSQEVYKCHNHPITHCLFSPNASRIASVDSDANLKVWSSSSAQNTLASYQSRSPILCVDWVSPADSLVLIGCADSKIKMFDVNSQMCLWDVNAEKNSKKVVSLSCSPTGSKFAYATSSSPNVGGSRLSAMVSSWRPQEVRMNSGTLAVLDMKSSAKEAMVLMEAGSPAVNCTTFNHNGSLLLAGGSDGIVRLFDISRQECLLSWTACPNGQVYRAQFSTDETSAYTMGSDGRFIQWSIHKTGKKTAEYSIHGDAHQPLYQWTETGSHATHTREVTKANLFALEAEGQHILTAGAKQAVIYQLSLATSELKKALTISGHEGPITSVDWSGLMNYSTCVTGSCDHTVRVTNLLKQ